MCIVAAVQSLIIVYGNTSSTMTDMSTVTTITFIENEPIPVRCIARGGSPPPDMVITIDREDYTKHFQFESIPGILGDVGFRTLQMTTVLFTDAFRATTRLDGRRLKCIAHVSGMSRVIASALITVHCKLMYYILNMTSILARFINMFCLCNCQYCNM